MMQFIVFRFWPALLPFVVYLVWYRLAVKSAAKEGRPKPRFRDGPVFWTVVTALLIAAIGFVFLGVEMQAEKGVYVPPALQDGKIVPGHIE